MKSDRSYCTLEEQKYFNKKYSVTNFFFILRCTIYTIKWTKYEGKIKYFYNFKIKKEFKF